jgi:hypothetical protein
MSNPDYPPGGAFDVYTSQRFGQPPDQPAQGQQSPYAQLQPGQDPQLPGVAAGPLQSNFGMLSVIRPVQ